MINQNLLIFNNTTFTLPETVPVVSRVIPRVLNDNQSLKRKGYVSKELLISIPDVYHWVTGMPLMPLNFKYPIEIPGTTYNDFVNTNSYAEISALDPYPASLLNNMNPEKYEHYIMLKHIYSVLGTSSAISGRILKGVQRALNDNFKKSPKTLLLLSFLPELRFLAEFVLYHLRGYTSLYPVRDKSPKIVELGTVEFNDAQSRKIIAMRTEDIAISYTKSSRKAFISHINTSAHTEMSRQDAPRRDLALKDMRVRDSNFIFDLSQVDYHDPTHNTHTLEVMVNAITEAFKKVEKDFVKVCIDKIATPN